MNELIEQLMLEAGYAAPELAGRAQVFTELLVKHILTTVDDTNINRSVCTTYDLSIAESVRSDIIQAIAQSYGVVYNQKTHSQKLFPVKTNASRYA
jgi:hypothetical protein